MCVWLDRLCVVCAAQLSPHPLLFIAACRRTPLAHLFHPACSTSDFDWWLMIGPDAAHSYRWAKLVQVQISHYIFTAIDIKLSVTRINQPFHFQDFIINESTEAMDSFFYFLYSHKVVTNKTFFLHCITKICDHSKISSNIWDFFSHVYVKQFIIVSYQYI